MRLHKLTLENFQGIKELSLDFPDGCSGSIYGDNATGKTTVYNALTWLLFDRASTGAKGFTPKTRGKDGELHHLNHSSTGTFILDDGKTVTLQKVYKEQWTKKRGSATESMTGHTTDYFIDGVPTTQKDYNAKVTEYCGGDAEKIKILTMPEYFPEVMKWEDRRKILIDLCGDVSDADVVASDKELEELASFTAGHTIDEYRKIVTAQRKEINKQLNDIPSRIDEATKAMPDVSDIDADTMDNKIKAIQGKIAELQVQKEKAVSGDSAVQDIQKKISNLEREYSQGEVAYLRNFNDSNSERTQKISTLEAEISKQRMEIADNRQKATSTGETITKLRTDREQLLKDFSDVANQKWNAGQEICPTCGQRLPVEKISELRESFNLKKSQTLERLNKKGIEECSKDRIAELEAQQKSYSDKADAVEQDMQKNCLELATERGKLINPTPYSETQQGRDTQERIDNLKASLTDSKQVVESQTQGINEELDNLHSKLHSLIEQSAQLGQVEAQRKRIEELEEQEKELSKEFELTEKGLYLSDQFIRQKVRLLTDRINSKFKSVSFQLFVDQINGGLKESCEVLVPGAGGRMVPYAFANHASRINAGLEIIDTLSKAWKITMPVIVDNAEAITKMATIDSQVIRLVVSENDKILRLATAKEI